MSSYAISFEQNPAVSLHPILKNSLSILMGVSVTMALFFMMYSLIKNDAIPVEVEETPPMPALSYKPPIIENKYPTLELPIKPIEQPRPPVQTNYEPIKTNIESVIPKIPVINEPTKNILLSIENNQVLPMVRVNPVYPQPAAAKGIEGFVDVMFDVTETGSTQNIEVVYAEPERIFNSAVVKAVSRWKYKPKMEDGVAVRMAGVRERIRFNIEK